MSNKVCRQMSISCYTNTSVQYNAYDNKIQVFRILDSTLFKRLYKIKYIDLKAYRKELGRTELIVENNKAIGEICENTRDSAVFRRY